MNTGKIRDIREDHDITQEEMAKILGIKRSTYSLYEIEYSTMSIETLCAFADYFEISIDYALGLAKNKGNSTLKKGIDLKVLGKNIRKMRKNLHLSQIALADKIEVTQACISKYEKGIGSISIDNLYALSKVFKVSLATLCDKNISDETKSPQVT